MFMFLKSTEEMSFLNNANTVAIQQSLRDLDTAYNNFFRKTAGFPKFKSKKVSSDSYRSYGRSIRVEKNKVYLPGLKWVKFRKSQNMDGLNIKYVTVRRTNTGKYYAILTVEFEPAVKSATDKAVGIDLGIKDFAIYSNGEHIANPHFLKESMNKLKREQKKTFKAKEMLETLL